MELLSGGACQRWLQARVPLSSAWAGAHSLAICGRRSEGTEKSKRGSERGTANGRARRSAFTNARLNDEVQIPTFSAFGFGFFLCLRASSPAAASMQQYS